MSLIVYTSLDKQNIPKYIIYNDYFFNTETNLSNTELVNKILAEIDEATFNSELTFIGRTKEMGALNKKHLSSGAKTLINIISHPDKCFNVLECGGNALNLLPLITEGQIYWEYPVAAYDGDGKCDIIHNGIHYTDFYEFLNSFE